jgi:uncharacterized protein (DUF58 family)
MLKEFHYKIDWRTKSHLPGHHRSTQSGGGLEFRGNVPLLAAPDPRRLDIRASLSDPFDQWYVRSFRQRSQVPVYLIADLSGSMGFRGENNKLDVLADFTEAVARSVHRTGDRFAFVGCDDVPRTDFLLPLTHSLGAGLDIAARLRDLAPTGKSAAGLVDAARYLPRQRSLVFLVSDFHLDQPVLDETLQSLAAHYVCPIVLWDRAEFERMPRFGIASLQDSETGRRQTIILRRSFRERLMAAFDSRRKTLIDFFHTHGMRPLFVEDTFNAERMTEYFFRANHELGEVNP